MTWWIWILLGLALLAVEIAIPGGIIMLFFGVSAMIVGVLVALGVGGPLWFQAVLFSVLSVVSLLTLRGPILRRMKSTGVSDDQVDSIAGEQAVMLGDIAPGAEGRAELRGTSWAAKNIGDGPLTEGQKCIVDRVDGLKLYVR
jgi:membrane protein implicated in regulation of membrane protease activity